MSPKKKMAIWIAALAIGSLATVAATSAGAFGGHCKRGGRRARRRGVARLEHRLERLDLSADVRAKAFAIIDARAAKSARCASRSAPRTSSCGRSLESGAPNANALDAQVEALGALKTQQHKQFLHTLIEVGALLPDEQRAQWFGAAAPRQAAR